MTIAKPHDKKISREDLESNNTILPGDEFHVCYADPLTPNDPIGYVNCAEDYEYFLQIIEWVNSNNYSALIWIEDSAISKARGQLLPETLNPNLCFSYEGFFAEKDLIAKLQSAQKDLDNVLNPAMIWMLDKLAKEKNILVFMDSAGKFTKFGFYSWYEDKGITYFIHGKASKNSQIYSSTTTHPMSLYCGENWE